jgi:diguanylate cyclase (GGDEF)-like protein
MHESFRAPSFKARILLVVLVLLIVGVWGLAVRVSAVLQATLEQLLAEQMSATVAYVASDLDSRYQMRVNTLTEIAAGVTPAMLADPSRLQRHLAQHETSRELFPTGIFATNRAGAVIAEYPFFEGRIGGFIGDRAFFKELLARNSWVITEPYVGRFVKKPITAIAVPLRDAQGQVAGVIEGTTYPSDPNLFGQLEQVRLGKTGKFLVFDPKSRLTVSATDKYRIMQVAPSKGVNPLLDRRLEEGFEGPGITLNSEGVVTLSVSGTMKTTGWVVIAALPVEEAFAPVGIFKRQVYLAALLMSLVIAAILHYVLSRQLAPLKTAGEAMRRMTDGTEPFAPIAVKRHDEIGQLVENFNQLVLGRRSAEQQVEFLAHHDALTGLPNRLLVSDRMTQAIAHADRTKSKVALLFLDLDNFKTINDSLGHAVGDALLKSIASRLRECVRDTDTISRQGGDEFLIILPELSEADATAPILVKIMERLQEPALADGHELTTSISMGVAIYPDDGDNFETLLKRADMAMYRAKDAGRNTYRFFDEQMNVEAVEHLTMRNGLRRAVERREFVLHYQPQIDLASGAVVGVEALIRWNHPDFGMIPPGRFISVAEESGLIVPIGEWVLREACRQAMAWRNAGLPELLVAVNISAVQFKRGDVEQIVIGALEESGFDPSWLELEITESVLIHNTENILATVKRLKSLGVKLSIDDFGTGYSSLSYLKRFAVDKLKIDQTFVRDLATDTDDASIVRAIIQMARSLGLETIAEGVETAQMLALLREYGCDQVQGYYFARPMPAEELALYLGKARALKR